MNQGEIDAFLAIVEQGTLSGAAETLYLTQSALSSRLELLEKETGARLVRRRKGIRRIELTEAGKRMVPVARKWKPPIQEAFIRQSFHREMKSICGGIRILSAGILTGLEGESRPESRRTACS